MAWRRLKTKQYAASIKYHSGTLLARWRTEAARSGSEPAEFEPRACAVFCFWGVADEGTCRRPQDLYKRPKSTSLSCDQGVRRP